MKLHCPECGAAIAAEDVNLATAMAKCRACANVFGFSGAVEAERGRRRAPDQPDTSLVARPPRMNVEDFAGTLTIRWRWFDLSYVAMALFCVAWDSFLIFWYSMALRN